MGKIIEFDKIYNELVCNDAPYTNDNDYTDPWDGEKPHAKNGFVEKYCEEYGEYLTILSNALDVKKELGTEEKTCETCINNKWIKWKYPCSICNSYSCWSKKIDNIN